MTKLHPWLAAAARRRPEHPALVSEHGTLSWRALAERSARRAAQLRVHGVRRGDRVAVLLDNDPECVVLMHATWTLGACLLPLNTRLGRRELAPLLERARPRLWIAGDPERAAGLPGPGRSVSEVCSTPADPNDLPDARSEPEADRLVLFTSGTTGRPRGARISERALRASALASARRLGVDEADRWLACMPLHHIGGLSIAIRSALAATTMLLEARFDEAAVARALAARDVTTVSLVPTMLQRLLDAGARPGPALRCILLGGGPLPAPLLERSLGLGLPVCTTYGLTEAASQVATLGPGELIHAPHSAGRALPGTQLAIVDDDGKRCATDEPGEIRVRGPQLMSGYVDDAEATARSLRGGWLHTGDIGSLDADGHLRVHDRRCDLIVRGGENVYPAEVEATLLACPDVAEVGVVGVPDAHWGQVVHAVVVMRAGARFDPDALARFAAERLARFKQPTSWARSDALPRTASGKLERHALRAAHVGAQKPERS